MGRGKETRYEKSQVDDRKRINAIPIQFQLEPDMTESAVSSTNKSMHMNLNTHRWRNRCGDAEDVVGFSADSDAGVELGQ